MTRFGVTLIFACAVAIFLMASNPTSAAPVLQFPWPAAQQHRISGGNTYICDTHDRASASGPAPLYNADKYAVDFQFGSIDGSPLGVAAAAAGVILYRSNNFDHYGNKIVIDHGGGLVSVYAHLQTNTWASGIAVGARVAQGQLLANAGGTGNWEGEYPVHLHFHMMQGNSAYTPEPLSNIPGPGDSLTSTFGQYGNCGSNPSPYWASRAPYAGIEGTLVKAGGATVYVIDNGQKRGISGAVFNTCYQWADISVVDQGRAVLVSRRREREFA